tara:strand:- start:745 stop:1062 length:318 start_codon:yes stop_codon:yes gene_type:complete
MMNRLFRTCAASLAALTFATGPVLADDTTADSSADEKVLSQFYDDVESIRSGLPSSGYDVSEAGRKCTAEVDALVQALPVTISSNFRCDVGDTGGIVILGGAALR